MKMLRFGISHPGLNSAAFSHFLDAWGLLAEGAAAALVPGTVLPALPLEAAREALALGAPTCEAEGPLLESESEPIPGAPLDRRGAALLDWRGSAGWRARLSIAREKLAGRAGGGAAQSCPPVISE